MRRWSGPRLARAVLGAWSLALFAMLLSSTRSLPDATTSTRRGGADAAGGAAGGHADEIARLVRSLTDHGGKAAAASERARIKSATRKQMEDDSMKQKNARTGEWRRLRKPRNLTIAEMDGYRRVADNEEVRVLRLLAAQTPCADKAACASLALSEVGDELRTLRLGDLFVSRAARASDAAMRAAFGASAANATSILFGDEDKEVEGGDEGECASVH